MKRNPKVESLLISIVNSIFNVDINKKSRKQQVIDARCVFFKILFDFKYSKTDIASVLGMHHATIIHSLRMMPIYQQHDSFLKDRYDKCRQDFNEQLKDIHNPIEVTKITHEDILRNRMVALKIDNDALKKEIKSLHSTIKEFGEYASLIRIIKDRVHKNNVEEFKRNLHRIANGIYK